jgi:hypothetical protein
MNKKSPLVVIVLIAFSPLIISRAWAQQSNVQAPKMLYSVLKYGDEHRQDCLNLLTGALEASTVQHQRCHLRYGFMSSGRDLDWFSPAVVDGDRSVIKDLGELEWTSRFDVPVMAALTKLLPGEHRKVSVNFSAADGARGVDYGYGPGDLQGHSLLAGNDSGPGPYTPKKKHKEIPETDPPFIIAKASLGHLYVLHVVDDANDFYALVRVDALERGDHVTISWHLISAPEPKATRKK